MDSKCKYWMLLLTLLCVISLGFSLFRVFPCEVGNETFLGIVLSAVGIIVTLVMGYQIFSVVEFRGELQKQKEENIKLAHDNAKLQQMIRNQMGALDKQKGRIEEGLNMCFSYGRFY
jgi:cell shape-determining protein MreC